MARGSRRLDEYLRQLGGVVGGGEAGFEEAIRRLVREAVQEALGQLRVGVEDDSSRALSDVVARLERVEERLREIEEGVRALREEVKSLASRGGLSRRDVEELARAIAAAIAASQAPRGGQDAREPRWLRLLADKLRERGGIVVLEELPPELRREVDTVLLESRGYVVAGIAGHRVIATREALREFGEKLRGLRASDEYEAEAALGRYGKLFRLLRSEGLVYYAGPRRGWVLEPRARMLLGL